MKTQTPTEIKIESVRVIHTPDSDADTSYLEQDGWEARLEEYRNGSFGFIGIVAEATVSYAVGNSGDRRLETLTSGGLHGIEDDSDKDYIESVEAEELEDLRSHLAVFGVEVPEKLTVTE